MSTSEIKNKDKNKRIMRGIVVSSKMDKGIVVRIDYRIQHPVFKKFVLRSKKIMAHDEQNQAAEGDYVAIEPCRPISKKKRFKLGEIIKKSIQEKVVEV
jgi:small subunit ribosomal protein S17